MSKANNPLTLDHATRLASLIIGKISQNCVRIEVAGSIRRRKAKINDIELVVIPRVTGMVQQGLIDEVVGFTLLKNHLFYQLEQLWKDCKITKVTNEDPLARWGNEYRKFHFVTKAGVPVKVDLFVTTPEIWSSIYMIRTGSGEFAEWAVTQREKGGGLYNNMRQKNGRLWRTAVRPNFRREEDWEAVDAPSEEDWFKEAGIRFIPPEKRSKEFAKDWAGYLIEEFNLREGTI